MKNYIVFVLRSFAQAFVGGWKYYAWMTFLTILALIGLNAYCKQLVHGLSVTGMTDQVSWGVYIANFTFLVGVATSAVMLVILVYIYKDKDLDHVVILGQLAAVASVVMCLIFVTVDLGRPDRFWHMIPGIGKFNWPASMLSWDVIALLGYLLLNAHCCGYLIYSHYRGRKPTKLFYLPFLFITVGWAISVQLVEAFLFVGLAGRPFWNSAIVAPRFLASAFVAGPAFIIVTIQIVRRFTRYRIGDPALMKLRGIIQVALLINVFLFVAEFFKEFYSHTEHSTSSRYLFFGLDGYHGLMPWIWTALAFNLIGLTLFLGPSSRKPFILNIACVLAFLGIWIEKGMGLIIPGFVPTPLGEIREYQPTLNETLICVGIWAFGFLLYSVFIKMTIPVLTGSLRMKAPVICPEEQAPQ